MINPNPWQSWDWQNWQNWNNDHNFDGLSYGMFVVRNVYFGVFGLLFGSFWKVILTQAW